MKSIYSFLLVTFLLVAISCDKDAEKDVTPTFKVVPEKTQVKVFEVFSIVVHNRSLKQSHYNAKLGDKEILLGRANDTLLIGMVPIMEAGKFDLKSTIENQEVNISYTISLAQTISNPALYLKDFVEQTDLENYKAILDAQVLQGIKTEAEATNEYNALKQAQAETLQKLTAATPEEQKEAAIFISSNRYLFDQISESLNGLRKAPDMPNGRIQFMDADVKYKIGKLTFALGKIGFMVAGPALVFVELGALIPGGTIGIKLWASAGAALGMAIFHNRIAAQKDIAVQAAMDIFDDLIVPNINSLQGAFLRTTGEEIFVNEIPRKVSISLKLRNIQPSDANSSVSLLSNFVVGYTKLSQIWSQFMKGFSALPAMIPLKEQALPVDYSKVTVQVKDNPNVTGTIVKVGEEYKIKFSSTEKTDQSFTFDIIYTLENIDPIKMEKKGKLEMRTVVDVDGNVYNIIQIGSQFWLKEDLKTTKLNDGSFIRQMEYNNTPHEFSWLYWNTNYVEGYWKLNEKENEIHLFSPDKVRRAEKFGYLYTWTTANSGKLCPQGWHIPSVEEWNTLKNFLGGENVAGGKMKATGSFLGWWQESPGTDYKEDPNSTWYYSSYEGTNESNFSAQASGMLSTNSWAVTPFEQVLYWSKTESSSTEAFSIALLNVSSEFWTIANNKTSALTCRCLQD